MESLRDWVLLLGGTALLSAVIGALAPPGAKQAFRVLCAVSVLYAVLLPLRGITLDRLDFDGCSQRSAAVSDVAHTLDADGGGT